MSKEEILLRETWAASLWKMSSDLHQLVLDATSPYTYTLVESEFVIVGRQTRGWILPSVNQEIRFQLHQSQFERNTKNGNNT